MVLSIRPGSKTHICNGSEQSRKVSQIGLLLFLGTEIRLPGKRSPHEYPGTAHRLHRLGFNAMKAAVLHQYDTSLGNPDFVTLDEVPEPQIQTDTDVIVRIGGAGVCRTDLHVIEGIWRQKVD